MESLQGGSNYNTPPDKMQFLDNRVTFMHGFCGRLFRWEGKIAFNSKQDQSES